MAGADVVLADIDTEGAERVAEKVRKLGRKAIVVHLDVSKEDQVQQAVDKAVAEFGRIGFSSAYDVCCLLMVHI